MAAGDQIKKYSGILRTGASMGADFIPIVGNVKSVVEVISGKDYITGEKLKLWERGLSAVGIIVPQLKVLKKAKTAVNLIDGVADVAKNVDNVVDAADAARKIEKGIDAVDGAKQVGHGMDAIDASKNLDNGINAAEEADSLKKVAGGEDMELPFSDVKGKEPSKVDSTPDQIKKITDFDNPADPFRDVLGAGSKSHPEEWNKLIQDLEANGVEVIYREGGLGYGPLRKGEAGQILLDPNASMSALRHEYSHFIEAKANGFPSAAQSYQDWEGRIADELKAYTIEIEEAARLGLDDVVNQLKKNFEEEKQYIIDRFKPIE
jgi:hypothetical protein